MEGELHLDPLKFSQLITKTVIKNNGTSGKILLPSYLVNEEVVVLIPAKGKSRGKKEER